MKGWSKAVGAGLGYFVGGPIGAVLGYVAGHKLGPKLSPSEGHLLVANLLGFIAAVLKVDGPPAQDETRETVCFISRLSHFDDEDERLAVQLLDRLLAVDLDISAMALTFRRYSNRDMRHRLLEILATLCLLLYGSLEAPHLQVLRRIATALKLDRTHWQALKIRYRAASPTLDPACCYALLQLSPEASITEIRAAYRRLAKKHHPDRATRLDGDAPKPQVNRMILINTAYEIIRVQRGF